jgi:hypothetical protein
MDNGERIGSFFVESNTAVDSIIERVNAKFGKDTWSHFRIDA